jgi:hypothetical protein
MRLKYSIYLIIFLFLSTSFAQEKVRKIDNSNLIVYITKTGSKYHEGTCRYLSKSKIPIKLAEAIIEYSACSVCLPPILSTIQSKNIIIKPVNKDVTVFITRTGKKYHRGSCRYLKRSKIPISLSKAKKRYSPCRVCRPPT